MPYRDPDKRRANRRESYWRNREKKLAYDRVYRADPAVKLKIRERQRAYYLRNREEFLLKAKQYRKANPEKRKAAAQRYAKRHPEVLRAKSQRYFERHPERRKAIDKRYAQSHPATIRVRNNRRKARLAGVLHSLTVQQWEAILTLHGNRCAYCGRDDVRMTQDHVVPITRGGGHTADNVVPACLSCNSKNGARTPEEWWN